MNTEDLNMEELRRILLENAALSNVETTSATPVASSTGQAPSLPVNDLPIPPIPPAEPTQAPRQGFNPLEGGLNMGSYRGREVTNQADPDFERRMAALGSFRDQTLGGVDNRADKNRRNTVDLAALGMQHATAYGTPNMAPMIDALNRENTTRNSTDMSRIENAARDADRVSEFVRKAFEDTRTTEQQDYSRGQDALRNRREDAQLGMQRERLGFDRERLGFDRERFGRERFAMMEGVLTPDGRPVFVDRNSVDGGAPRVVDSAGQEVRDLRALRGLSARNQILQADSGAYSIDPVTGRATPVTTPEGMPIGGRTDTNDPVRKAERERLAAVQSSAAAAPATLDTVRRIQELTGRINEGSMIGTGSFNGTAERVGDAAQSVFGGNPLMVRERQELNNLVQQQLAGQIESMRGMGSLSDRDLASLRERIATGNLTPESIRSITDQVAAIAQYNQQKYERWRQSGQTVGFMDWSMQDDQRHYAEFMRNRGVGRTPPVTSGTGPTTTTPPATTPSAPGVPQVGEVVNGFRFKGGNPRDRNNWEQVR